MLNIMILKNVFVELCVYIFYCLFGIFFFYVDICFLILWFMLGGCFGIFGLVLCYIGMVWDVVKLWV